MCLVTDLFALKINPIHFIMEPETSGEIVNSQWKNFWPGNAKLM